MNQAGFTLMELMVVVGIIGILTAIALPNYFAYRNKAFCAKAESDANNIASDVVEYFAIPTHTTIATADITFNPNANSFTIVGPTAVNTAVTITVTDVSGRCPAGYRNNSPVNAHGDGWNGLVYQKVVAQ